MRSFFRRPVLCAAAAVILFGSAAAAEPVFTVYVPVTSGAEARAVLADGREFSLGTVRDIPTSTRWRRHRIEMGLREEWRFSSQCGTTDVSVEKDAGRTCSILPLLRLLPLQEQKRSLTLTCLRGQAFSRWGPVDTVKCGKRRGNASLRKTAASCR